MKRLDDWGFLWSALIIAFLIQSFYLPCLCADGDANLACAYLLDLMVVVRLLLAKYRQEHNKTWMIYAALLLTSHIWINWLHDLVHHFAK